MAFGKENLVSCDGNCKEAHKSVQSESLKAAKQKEEDEILRNQREAELFERQLEGGGKKRRRNRRTECNDEEPSFLMKNKTVLISALASVVMAGIIYFIMNT